MKTPILLAFAVAIGALLPMPASSDIAWPSGLDELVRANMESAIPSGAAAGFGAENAFSSQGSVGYVSAASGDSEDPFDTVGAVVRFTAGGNLSTTAFGFILFVR